MEELIANIHVHSCYSDGSGTHNQIAEAGLKAGVDVILMSDHNVLVHEAEKYYQKGRKKVLVLIGEEVHDQSTSTPGNHLLVYGAQKEMCTYASDPQNLIRQVNRAGGLSFIAHPFEDSLSFINEPEFRWNDWSIGQFTGLEIWNHLSELKTRANNWFSLLFFVFFPQFYGESPNNKTLQRWDELLVSGKKIVAIGGSDSHALEMQRGFIRKVIFPYEFHFSCVNTHLLVPKKLSENIQEDRKMVYEALRKGNAFVGYDLPAPTNGFRFTAQGTNETAQMGEEVMLNPSVTLQILIPERTHCKLIKDGHVVREWHDQKICAFITREPGAYRVECTIQYLGKERGWIYSNPIYVRQPKRSKGYGKE